MDINKIYVNYGMAGWMTESGVLTTEGVSQKVDTKMEIRLARKKYWKVGPEKILKKDEKLAWKKYYKKWKNGPKKKFTILARKNDFGDFGVLARKIDLYILGQNTLFLNKLKNGTKSDFVK